MMNALLGHVSSRRRHGKQCISSSMKRSSQILFILSIIIFGKIFTDLRMQSRLLRAKHAHAPRLFEELLQEEDYKLHGSRSNRYNYTWRSRTQLAESLAAKKPLNLSAWQSAATPKEQFQTAKAKNWNLRPFNSSNTTTQSSHYAYAFVIGGCDPDQPKHYRGFVYNILVATRILRDLGSTVDVVAFFQVSFTSSANELPLEDRRALQALGIQIRYIPKSEHESFYETVLEKFRILTLTQYRRVLLMDGDIMPIANLDFLFAMTDDDKYGPNQSTLKPNVLVSGPFEPANAGFFMLSPEPGDFEHIQRIIHRRHEKAIEDGVGRFDEVNGWGHVIQEGDEWVVRRRSNSGTPDADRGRNWTFHFAFSDQGLLYHWTKYVKKEFSIFFEDYVENWSSEESRSGMAVRQRVIEKPFRRVPPPLIDDMLSCKKFLCYFLHNSGGKKPWLTGPPKDLDRPQLFTGHHLWWNTLKEIDRDVGMNLTYDPWTIGRPTHGLWASWSDLHRHYQKYDAYDRTNNTGTA